MNGVALLADFGASRVKAALYDPAAGRVLVEAEEPSPVPSTGGRGEVEVDPAAYAEALFRLTGAVAASAGVRAEACMICSEMHGFVLADDDLAPLTPYVSWRDERAVADGTLEMLRERCGDAFRDITGMRLKAGLPFVTLASMARSGGVPDGARLLTLPEWIAASGGRWSGAVDETMAAATGLWDLRSHAWSDELVGILADLGGAPVLGTVVTGGSGRVGAVAADGEEVLVLGGVGDLQAAVLGSGVVAVTGVCVNIGTGSQVSRVGVAAGEDPVEARPFFPPHDTMTTISHIPAGRALVMLEREFAPGRAASERFWALLADLTCAGIESAALPVDLNVFAAAWRHADGGALTHLEAGSFEPEDLAAGIGRAMADQYAEAIALIDPGGDTDTVVMAGGLARRVGGLADALAERTGKAVTTTGGTDETLTGLRLLYEAGAGP